MDDIDLEVSGTCRSIGGRFGLPDPVSVDKSFCEKDFTKKQACMHGRVKLADWRARASCFLGN